MSAYLSTTVPAATASASDISVLDALAKTSTAPVVVTSRLSSESIVSSATPTATDAPTAVLSADTSPLAVDRVLDWLLADTVTLSVAVSPAPAPI